MRIFLIISLTISYLTNFSQTSGYVLQNSDGSIRIADGSLTINKISNLQTFLDAKQAILVSGTNIKTINGNTILGSGDLVVSGGATTSTSGVSASPTASSTQTVTHNLGRTPNIIRIYGIGTFTSNAAATPTPFSIGVFSSSGNTCVYMRSTGTTTQASQTSTTFSVFISTSSGNFISGVIQNVGANSFDIVWTETGTATAQSFLWEAQ